MDVTRHAVRAYGSTDTYGLKPRYMPPWSPIVLNDFPRRGSNTSVHMGELPHAFIRANKVRRAIGRLMISALFGGESSEANDRDALIEQYIAEDHGPPTGTEYNWYVTVVTSETVNVENQHLGQFPYLWIDFEAGIALVREALEVFVEAADLVAVWTSIVIGSGHFREIARLCP